MDAANAEARELTLVPPPDEMDLRPAPTRRRSAPPELEVVLPVGPLPEDPVEQRHWAELRKLQLETERLALDLDAARRREAEMRADAGQACVYTFYDAVEPDSVRRCLAELSTWSRRDPCAPITMVFNSPGGSVIDGLALFDYLRELRATGHHLTTVALGRAASMGAVLLQAGDHRVMGANAFMLLHEVSAGSSGKVSSMEDSVEFTKRLQRRLVAILSERASLTGLQIERRWRGREWWLDAGEAADAGLVDEVR